MIIANKYTTYEVKRRKPESSDSKTENSLSNTILQTSHFLISLASAGHEKSLLVILITCFFKELGCFCLEISSTARKFLSVIFTTSWNRITSALLFTSLSRSTFFFLSLFPTLKNNFVFKWKIMQEYDNLQQMKRHPGFVVVWLFLLPGLSLTEEWPAHSLEIATNELQRMNLLLRSTIYNNGKVGGGGDNYQKWKIVNYWRNDKPCQNFAAQKSVFVKAAHD